jgi:6-phosphofructo-2-kinase/fructose-2,6-biphosphatase 2
MKHSLTRFVFFKVIETNIREVKVSSPDYKNVQSDEVVSDFLERIRFYQMNYETIDEHGEKQLSFIKIFNVGERFLVNRVIGHIQSRVVYFLMNIRVLPRTIYLTRHGESDMNLEQRIGGDSNLSARGRKVGHFFVAWIIYVGECCHFARLEIV